MGQFALLYQPIIVASGNPYTHSYQLTIDHTQCGGSDSSNFPVLVSLTLTNLKTVANGGVVQNTVTFNGQTVAADVVFSLSSAYGSLLNWDFDSYDAVNGIINVWVSIPTVSHTSDTIFYMGVGSASTTTYQGGAVGAAWNSNYVGVYHLANGSTLSGLDSTSNSNNLTNNGASATTGIIDGGESQNTSLTYLDIPLDTNMAPSSITVSAWINPTSLSTSADGYIALVGKDDGNGPPLYSYSLLLKSNGTLAWYINTVSSTQIWQDGGGATLSVGDWSYVAGTYTSGIAASTFISGTLDATGSNSIASPVNSTTSSFWLGHSGFGLGDNRYYSGILDEVRVQNVVASADQLLTEYNNQKASSTFLSQTLLY